MPDFMEMDLQTIQARQREITAEMERLRAEAEELDIAIRVFMRYSKANGAGSDTPKLGPSRPPGAPSLFDMTAMVIKDANASGKAGLTAQEIVTEIGKRYWPGVKAQQILPPIYGFSKRGRLRKNSKGVFSLPQE
jgi:hypothetical protein